MSQSPLSTPSAPSHSAIQGTNHTGPALGVNNAHIPEVPEDRFIKECRQKGRWVNVAISFGIDIQVIFRYGIQADILELDDDNEEQEGVFQQSTMTEQEKELVIEAYRTILRFIPRLKELLPFQPNGDEELLFRAEDAIQEGCNAARSEAIRRIKDNTIRYLLSGQKPVNVDPQVNHKELRGLNDRDIGRLLIPADDVREWDLDPDASRAHYLSGEFLIHATEMPVFLYENYTYNDEDPEEGLFRGSFLVCVLIDILYGSNAVNTKDVKRVDQARHHCLGEMYGLTSISPMNIGYAAVVARFTLSSKRFWSIQDDNFNYRTFYQSVVSRLSDKTDPWVQDTLAWWNMRVFGNERGKVVIEDVPDDADEEWHKFMRRRAARIAASRAMRARMAAMSHASVQDVPQDNGPGPSESFTHQEPRDDASILPSTPPSRPAPVIDPGLLDTPDLDVDTSTLTRASPPLRTPEPPEHPMPSGPSNLSPLSDVPDGDANGQAPEEIRNKRKRQASKADRSRAKGKRRASTRV